MKRYRDIESIIESGKLDNDEILVLNEATLMKNVVETSKKTIKSQHDTIVIPLLDETGNVIRRMGVFDKETVKSTDVDVVIMQGQVHNDRFLIIPVECDGAKIFESEPKQTTTKPDNEGLE